MSFFKRLINKPKKKFTGETAAGSTPLQYGKPYSSDDIKAVGISSDLEENYNNIKSILGHSVDIIMRKFKLGASNQVEAFLLYVDDFVDLELVSDNVLTPLVTVKVEPKTGNLLKHLMNEAITLGEININTDLHLTLQEVLYGNVALFVDGEDSALSISAKKFPHRPVADSVIEPVVRGPREAFTEILAINTAMVRRRMKDPNFVIESIVLGKRTKTSLAILYFKGIVDPDLVSEVKHRLNNIEIDGVLESHYLEELIQDSPFSPFPQIGNTERPDRVVSALLQGRVAILTDGTPFALWVPARLGDLLQSPEDYYQGYMVATVLRWLRFLAFGLSVVLPSLYIAITTFHQEMIPPTLLISIISFREGVPFPAFVEALIMEVTFEALREAGIRLPRPVGQAVSIVGALVLGQAAISAKLVSPLMVIVVAITGIASFMVPAYTLGLAFRLMRFPLMILAASLGLFGIMGGIILLLIHLTSLRSFGAPYMAPLGPTYTYEFKDTLVRAPWWAMTTRPSMGRANWRRQPRNKKPEPPPAGGDTQ